MTTINILLNDFPWILSLFTQTPVVDSLGDEQAARNKVIIKRTKGLFFHIFLFSGYITGFDPVFMIAEVTPPKVNEITCNI